MSEPSVLLISYSHDDDSHRKRVLGLSERLRRDGFDARIDQYVNGSPSEGWPRWMLDQIDASEWVLVVCTEAYYRRFRGHDEPGVGKGATFEGLIITQELYDAHMKNSRFVPVLFDSTDTKFVPEPLRPGTHYRLTSEESYQALLAALRRVAGVEAGPIETTSTPQRPTATPLQFNQQDSKSAAQGAEWPAVAPDFGWPIADHTEAQRAFCQLVTQSSPSRLLLIEGLSETGKTHLGKQMERNIAELLPELRCGRLDFKGTTDRHIEVDGFVRSLRLSRIENQELSDQLGEVLVQLENIAAPTVLVFDTFEQAGESRTWIERIFLPTLLRATWLRVILLGQSIPSRNGALWESIAANPIRLNTPGPEHWYEYGRVQRPDEGITLEFVTDVHRLANGKPSLLATLLGPKDWRAR